MAIVLTKSPKQLFLEHMLASNNKIPATADVDSLEIKNITQLRPINYLPLQYHSGGYVLSAYPNVKSIEFTAGFNMDRFNWFVVKRVRFSGADVTWHARGDDNIRIYLDGLLVGSSLGHSNEATGTFTVSAGEHELLLTTGEASGPTYMIAVFDDDGTVFHTDIDWRGTLIGTGVSFNYRDWIDPLFDTSVEIDLIGHGSEVNDDFVKFTYKRIPLRRVLLNLDTDLITEVVELPYSDVGIFVNTVTFSNYFLNTYGINLANDGILVTSKGSGVYTVNVDNITYLGELTFIPD